MRGLPADSHRATAPNFEWITRNPRRVAAGPRLYRCLPAQRTPEAGSSRWPIDHAGRAQDRSVSCGPRNSSVTGRAVTIAVGVVYTRPSPASSNGVACRGAYPDHTHAELRQTQPSRVSAGRVCVPQVGHAIGAPIFSNFVASAESSGAARRGPRAGTFSPIVIDPLSPSRTRLPTPLVNESDVASGALVDVPSGHSRSGGGHTRGRRTGGNGTPRAGCRYRRCGFGAHIRAGTNARARSP